MRTITLNQIGYLVEGVTTLNLWGGGTGDIRMKPIEIKELNTVEVLKAINDNGFGCESYDSACVDIYRLYEDNVTRHLVSVDFSREDLWAIGNVNCNYSELAKEYEKKYEAIVDTDDEGEE